MSFESEMNNRLALTLAHDNSVWSSPSAMDDSKISIHMVYEATETRKAFHTHLSLPPPSPLLRLTFLLPPLWSVRADKGLNAGAHFTGNTCRPSQLCSRPPGQRCPTSSLTWEPLSALRSPRPSPAQLRSVHDPISPSVLWLCRSLFHILWSSSKHHSVYFSFTLYSVQMIGFAVGLVIISFLFTLHCELAVKLRLLYNLSKPLFPHL